MTAEWKTLYDQGGLCLILPGTEQQDQSVATATQRKWVKTGIEFYDGVPKISTVVCDRWADWNLFPLSNNGEDGRSVKVEMEREVVNGKGTSTLWVFVYGKDGVRMPVREVTWVFEGANEKEIECWIGIYAAKPMKDEDDQERQLNVTFDGLSIETF